MRAAFSACVRRAHPRHSWSCMSVVSQSVQRRRLTFSRVGAPLPRLLVLSNEYIFYFGNQSSHDELTLLELRRRLPRPRDPLGKSILIQTLNLADEMHRQTLANSESPVPPYPSGNSVPATVAYNIDVGIESRSHWFTTRVLNLPPTNITGFKYRQLTSLCTRRESRSCSWASDSPPPSRPSFLWESRSAPSKRALGPNAAIDQGFKGVPPH